MLETKVLPSMPASSKPAVSEKISSYPVRFSDGFNRWFSNHFCSPGSSCQPDPSRESFRWLPLEQEAAAVAVAVAFALVSVPAFGCQGTSGCVGVAKHVNVDDEMTVSDTCVTQEKTIN